LPNIGFCLLPNIGFVAPMMAISAGPAKGCGLGWRAPVRYSDAMKTVRLHIFGRVQGVGYRAWAMQRAAELGLRGWVRNRGDGSVDMLVTGAEDTVNAIVEAARRGPSAARVERICLADAEDDSGSGFVALPTA
jgi:acylphosphatase